RLELLAAVHGIVLALTIKRALEEKKMKIHFWTDSRNVLWWIRSETKELLMFVSRRVDAILKHSTKEQWHWVNGEQNPADIVSRGANLEELAPNDLWWHGPKYLLDGKECWPKEPQFEPTQEILGEFKKHAYNAGCVYHNLRVADWRFPLEDFSSWSKLLRRLSIVFCCFNIWREKMLARRHPASGQAYINVRSRRTKLGDKEPEVPHRLTREVNLTKLKPIRGVEEQVSKLRSTEIAMVRARDLFEEETEARRIFSGQSKEPRRMLRGPNMQERDSALMYAIHVAQREGFPKEIEDLLTEGELHHSSPLFEFYPILDTRGTL